MVLDLELSTKFRNHSIVEVGSIINDDLFRDTVTVDEFMLDKPGLHFGDLGLVPGVVIPHKFKIPIFSKYDGVS